MVTRSDLNDQLNKVRHEFLWGSHKRLIGLVAELKRLQKVYNDACVVEADKVSVGLKEEILVPSFAY